MKYVGKLKPWPLPPKPVSQDTIMKESIATFAFLQGFKKRTKNSGLTNLTPTKQCSFCHRTTFIVKNHSKSNQITIFKI
jgi:hypothetical protein